MLIGGLTDDEQDLLQHMLDHKASEKELASISAKALIKLGAQDLIVYEYRSGPSVPTGSVPLPASLPLLLGGIFGLASVRRRLRA